MTCWSAPPASSALTSVIAAQTAAAAQRTPRRHPLRPRPRRDRDPGLAPARPRLAARRVAVAAAPSIPAGSVTFNTVITKLKEGKQIFSNTIMRARPRGGEEGLRGPGLHLDRNAALAADLARGGGPDPRDRAGRLHSVRARAERERGDIQKATDAGALGIIVPMVDTIEEARRAVMYAKWPIGSRDNPNTKPWGHRSSGGGQFTQLWGNAYQSNANNNILIMIQIENPQGVGMIDTILEEVPGIDIVMVASNDFGLQAGDRDGDESYNAREKIVREAVLKHGKILAGPSSWQNRPGYRLFQGRRDATNTGYDDTGNRIE